MSKLLKNSLLYTIGNIIPQAVSFLLLPVYAFYLNPEEYGIINSMTVLSTIIGIFLSLGIDKGIYRLYYDYDLYNRKLYLGTIIIGLSLFALIFSTLIILFPFIISWVYNKIPFHPYYTLMIAFTLLNKLATIPSIYLRVSEQASKFLLISIISLILSIVFNLLFIIIFKEGAIGMLKGTFYASLLMVPIYFFYTYKAIIFKFKLDFFKDSIKFSLPLLPGLIFAWILNLSDRIFIEKYSSLSDVGIYSFAYKLASTLLIISGGIFSAYNPYFFKLSNETGPSSKYQIEKINNYLISFFSIIAFFIVLWSKEFITLFIPSTYYSANSLIPILSVAFLFSQITGLLNLMIYQVKKSIYIMYVTFFSAIINVVLNFTLIPKFGIKGAALSTFCSFLAMFIIEYYYANKCNIIKLYWISFLKVIFILGSITLILELFTKLFLLRIILKLLLTVLIMWYTYVQFQTILKYNK